MTIILSTITAISVSHTMIHLNSLLFASALAPHLRIPLITMCISHLIQRTTMVFYLDASLSRNCTALIVLGNLFGILTFRYMLIHLLGGLYRAMRKGDAVGKWVTGVSTGLWGASSTAFMEHMITAPVVDPGTCGQQLNAWKTAVYNVLFLLSFLSVAGPTIACLGWHLRLARSTRSKGLATTRERAAEYVPAPGGAGAASTTPTTPRLPANTSIDAIDAVYYRQLVFMLVFSTSYVILCALQWVITEWGWLMFTFILEDYCWLQGIQLWTIPLQTQMQQALGSGARTTREGGMEGGYSGGNVHRHGSLRSGAETNRSTSFVA
ncbi:uncharacterized protein EV422DRAFT_617585 [Fimicolochytrium jonesii]|uniref:uncharacterized protein n=1 Tax=Fimicolochytrium jonesii TaxID=1396493 RepID=UPI0022FE9D27|nr:uncharacterized protein EV422DRAFT_617585 [Fimicolochytrium jonesii]KAI8825180.1 hypothetical protein EV422DRAFT_617585 [Fimicolochytrium jonesii]